MYYVLKQLPFLLILSLTLVACSTATTPPITTDSDEIYYIASVDIGETTGEVELQAQYGAKVLTFKPEAGFAVLGFSKEAGELTTLSTSINNDAFSAPEIEAGGHSAWAGGFSAWAGGFSAWAGGWSAWAGGSTIPATPTENSAAFDRIKLSEAHSISQNFGEGIVVAVIDTGIDYTHPMFKGRLHSYGWDYIDNDWLPYDRGGGSASGHGTAAAGLILQVAPKAKILPLRILDQNGRGNTDDLIAAIDKAITDGADVINLSLGTNVNVSAIQNMMNYAQAQGVYVIASNGNEGLLGTVTYPAAYTKSLHTQKEDPYIFSIGSLNTKGGMSSFSNMANGTVFAPGEELYSSLPGKQIGKVTGTSFAAPLVAGAFALALSEGAESDRANLGKHFASSHAGGVWYEGQLNAHAFIKTVHTVKDSKMVANFTRLDSRAFLSYYSVKAPSLTEAGSGNYFKIQSNGDGTDGYVAFRLRLNNEDWASYDRLRLYHLGGTNTGADRTLRIWIRDDSGWKYLGAGSTDTHRGTILLNLPSNQSDRDKIAEVYIRARESDFTSDYYGSGYMEVVLRDLIVESTN